VPELDQFQIVGEILRRSMGVAPPGWRELIVDYYIEGGNSCCVQSYLIEKDGKVVEKSLDDVPDLNVWMEKLQKHLAQAGRPPFTRCKIHLKSSGQYESTYGYDKVDWKALLNPDWNFFPRRASK
jgi:Protein of unknown function, DUF600